MGDAIGVVFTGPDKALLDRSARAAEAAAKRLGWEALVGKQRKSAKLEYDRLMRDAHDLRLMGVRLTKVAKVLRTPVGPPISVIATAPFHGPCQRAEADRRVQDVGHNHGADADRRSNGDRRAVVIP